MEDRVVAHFDINGLSGIVLSAQLNIPINNFDPGPPLGELSVYTFPGDGRVSIDEWAIGNRTHTFKGIEGNRDTLSVSITTELQSAMSSGESYIAFSIRAGSDRFWLDIGNNVPDSWISCTMASYTITAATHLGYIQNSIYRWDGHEFRPVSILEEDTLLQPWEGFALALPRHSGLDLLAPVGSNESSGAPLLELAPGGRYLISPPLQTIETDIEASSLGLQLNPGQCGKTWFISRWLWDNNGYHVYNGPDLRYDEVMSLRPGKGYFLQFLGGEPLSIDLDGYRIDTPGGYHAIPMHVSPLQPYTVHLAGNPYCYPVDLKDCYINIHEPDSTLTAQTIYTTSTPLWHIDVKLTTPNLEMRDTYNRAGVADGPLNLLRAIDLEPPGKFIRLSLRDPDQADPIRYAYDYRALMETGEEEYRWTIELSTNMPVINTVMTFDNISKIPERYHVMLINNQTGHLMTLDGDEQISETLYSNSPKTYTLIAAPYRIGVDEEPAFPFGLTAVAPNPFNPSTTISFSLDHPGRTRVSIFNTGGQLVETILDDTLDSGTHSLVWNADGQASGVYFVKLDADKITDVRKMLLIK